MIKVICVGKIKEKFYQEAINEYKKRLSKYTKIEIIEVEDVCLNNSQLILEKEKENIVRYLNDKDYIIVLDIDGEQLNSKELSKKISALQITNPNITFIIGGSYGLHESLKENKYKLSFSKLTFPHQLFRVILLEQIYRSYKIMNNEIYHK